MHLTDSIWLQVDDVKFQLTNGALQDRVAAFGTGLIRVARLQPQKSKVLLLLNDCLGTHEHQSYPLG